MKLDIFVLVFIGYFVKFSRSDGFGDNHVHFKISLPSYKHTHKHVHTVFKKPKGQKKIVIHKHYHQHGHDHDHEHDHGHQHKHKHAHQHGHKHSHGHKHNHQHNHKDGHDHYGYHDHGNHWSQHSSSFESGNKFKPQVNGYGVITSFNKVKPSPKVSVDKDGYRKTHKTIKSEKIHITKAQNSAAKKPAAKHYLSRSYNINDPYEVVDKEYHDIFHTPWENVELHKSIYKPAEDALEDDEFEEDQGIDGFGSYEYEAAKSRINYEFEALGPSHFFK